MHTAIQHVAIAALGAALVWEHRQRRAAEAKVERMRQTAGLDLDPIAHHLQGALSELALVGGITLTSKCRSARDAPVLRALS